MTCILCCRIPQRHLAFSFVQHNDGFLHILRVRAIRCGSIPVTCIAQVLLHGNTRQDTVSYKERLALHSTFLCTSVQSEEIRAAG